MALHMLSAREVQTTKVGDHTDGGGLFLRVGLSGSSWVFRYTAPDARRREMGLGAAQRLTLPACGESVKSARFAADKARTLLGDGRDPIDSRRAQRTVAKEATAAKRAVAKSTAATFARS